MEAVDSSDLKPFLLLAKTAKGAACAALIKQVLEHPGVNVFGELLDMPSVVELGNTSHAPSLELLKTFAYGTWRDYKAHEAELPALSDAQVIKLKKLSAVTFAAQSKILAYDVLMRELEISSVRELEDLLIECIYAGLISGRLDQQAACLEVFSAAGRDVHPKEIAAMSATLVEWHRNATGLMANVSSQLTRFKAQADEARKAQADLDEKVPPSAERARYTHDLTSQLPTLPLRARALAHTQTHKHAVRSLSLSLSLALSLVRSLTPHRPLSSLRSRPSRPPCAPRRRRARALGWTATREWTLTTRRCARVGGSRAGMALAAAQAASTALACRFDRQTAEGADVGEAVRGDRPVETHQYHLSCGRFLLLHRRVGRRAFGRSSGH